MNRRGGVYLHVPFCVGKCSYCDFYSLAADPGDYNRYTDALVEAIARSPHDLAPETLYFGGGTPSLLGVDRLLAVKAAADARFGPAGEVTLEANPGSIDGDALRALRAGGFTRVSFGVQSLNDGALRLLGRRHTAAKALDAVKAALDAGFEHVSADLMLAVPGQTIASIESDIDTLIDLGIDHLSAYLLKREPKTPFYQSHPEPDEDFAADCYLSAVSRCAERGLAQYEISNFARSPEAQSRHNLIYWRGLPYLGIGPAAHSFLERRRFHFPPDLAAFCNVSDPWSLILDDGPGGNPAERVMLGLRLTEGVPFCDIPLTEWELFRRIAPLERSGLLTRHADGHLALTPRGFLVSNSIIASLV